MCTTEEIQELRELKTDVLEAPETPYRAGYIDALDGVFEILEVEFDG